MAVSQLHLTNFRSYADHAIDLDPVVTLVVGPNATGKTNLLESLYVVATTKSFRAKDSELIRHGSEFYRLEVRVDDTLVTLGYQSGGGSSEKRVRHDNTPRSLTDHLGTLRVVLFEPNDLLLIHGGPERRRRYLDVTLTQTDKRFAKTLSQYRRVLQQRNRLLADWRGATNELFAWNVQLTELASEITTRRRSLIDRLNRLAAQRYRDIAGADASLLLVYRDTCDNAADYPAAFMQLLEANLPRDIGAGFTTLGPHRDDVDIHFNEAPIASVASRGEIRSAVLALKMAELAYLESHPGSHPLLLLDDVFSELDDARRRYLLEMLGDHQAVITTTNADISAELGASHATIHTQEFQRV